MRPFVNFPSRGRIANAFADYKENVFTAGGANESRGIFARGNAYGLTAIPRFFAPPHPSAAGVGEITVSTDDSRLPVRFVKRWRRS